MIKRILIVPVLLALILTGSQFAVHDAYALAETCPEIVTTALEFTGEMCVGADRNQACYGHDQIDADAQPGTTDFIFEKQGDITDLAYLRSLRLSPMDVESGLWGVSLMRLQANLPDASPEDNITLLIFGDVQIENLAEISPLVDVTVTTTINLNVREQPSTQAAVIGSLAPNQDVQATGRIADNSWLRVVLAEDGRTGWVYAPLVTTEADLETLKVVEADSTYYRPMQAFYFQSGETASPCPEAPENGLLVQTPHGVAEVRLFVNEVAIRLGSTAFIQAQPGGKMTVSLLEGSGEVEAAGETQPLYPGVAVDIPMSADLRPSGPPETPHPFEAPTMNALPVQLLARDITVGEPLSQADIDEKIAQANQPIVPLPPANNDDGDGDGDGGGQPAPANNDDGDGDSDGGGQPAPANNDDGDGDGDGGGQPMAADDGGGDNDTGPPDTPPGLQDNPALGNDGPPGLQDNPALGNDGPPGQSKKKDK